MPLVCSISFAKFSEQHVVKPSSCYYSGMGVLMHRPAIMT
jgi:hypothetical protein